MNAKKLLGSFTRTLAAVAILVGLFTAGTPKAEAFDFGSVFDTVFDSVFDGFGINDIPGVSLVTDLGNAIGKPLQDAARAIANDGGKDNTFEHVTITQISNVDNVKNRNGVMMRNVISTDNSTLRHVTITQIDQGSLRRNENGVMLINRIRCQDSTMENSEITQINTVDSIVNRNGIYVGNAFSLNHSTANDLKLTQIIMGSERFNENGVMIENSLN